MAEFSGSVATWRLTELDLSNNKISCLSPVISQLNSLTSLNVSNNLLNFIPTSLGVNFCGKAFKLDIRHNPLEQIPREIHQKNDSQRILEYLRDIHDKSIHWQRMKVVVVGEEGVR